MLLTVGIIAVAVVAIAAGIFAMKSRRSVPAKSVMIRSGLGGVKVFRQSSKTVWCFPGFHRVNIIKLAKTGFEVSFSGENCGVTSEGIQVVCSAEVDLESLSDDASVLAASRTGGRGPRSDQLLHSKSAAVLGEYVSSLTLAELQEGSPEHLEILTQRLAKRMEVHGFGVLKIELNDVSVVELSELKVPNPATRLYHDKKNQEDRIKDRAQEMTENIAKFESQSQAQIETDQETAAKNIKNLETQSKEVKHHLRDIAELAASVSDEGLQAIQRESEQSGPDSWDRGMSEVEKRKTEFDERLQQNQASDETRSAESKRRKEDTAEAETAETAREIASMESLVASQRESDAKHIEQEKQRIEQEQQQAIKRLDGVAARLEDKAAGIMRSLEQKRSLAEHKAEEARKTAGRISE